MKNFITNILINIESKLDSALNEINKAIKTQEEAINWSKNFYNLSLKDIKEAEKLGFKMQDKTTLRQSSLIIDE